jgi:hypothetical protein
MVLLVESGPRGMTDTIRTFDRAKQDGAPVQALPAVVLGMGPRAATVFRV